MDVYIEAYQQALDGLKVFPKTQKLIFTSRDLSDKVGELKEIKHAFLQAGIYKTLKAKTEAQPIVLENTKQRLKGFGNTQRPKRRPKHRSRP